MKTIKLNSIFALILFSILTFGLASIATSATTLPPGQALAWWSLEETSGDRYDSSGNGNTLTDNATVGYGT
ncbi:hypothetical protein ACFL0B_08015, partial [Thermodesulfobacteriota bacterium]